VKLVWINNSNTLNVIIIIKHESIKHFDEDDRLNSFRILLRRRRSKTWKWGRKKNEGDNSVVVLRNPADPVWTSSVVPFCFGQSHVEVMSVGPSAHGLWLWIHSMALCPSCLTILSLSLSLSHYNSGQLVSDSGAPRQTFPTTFFHFIYPTLLLLTLYTTYSKHITHTLRARNNQ